MGGNKEKEFWTDINPPLLKTESFPRTGRVRLEATEGHWEWHGAMKKF